MYVSKWPRRAAGPFHFPDMPSKFDTETKAKALGLARLGKTSPHIAAEIKAVDSVDVPERTIREWVHEARELAISDDRDRLLVDGEYRLAMQTQALTDAAVDSLVDSGEPLHKYLVPLNIVRGTAIDKILRSRERHAPTTAIQINVVGPDSKPIVEGHAVEPVVPESE